MKRILILLAIIVSVFTSCETENQNETAQSYLIGKWQPERDVLIVNDLTISDNSYNAEPCYGMTYFEFTTSQLIKVSADDVNGNCVENPIRYYSYNVNENKITINSVEYEILLLNNDRFTIENKDGNVRYITEYSKIN